MTSDLIPVIDISGFGDGTEKQCVDIGKAVDRACRDIGFLVIQGHGIAPTIVDDLHDAGRRFFDLPKAVKSTYETGPESYYGYNPMASSSLAYSLDDEQAKPDLREAFASSRPDIKTGDPFFRSDAVKDLGFDIDYPPEIESFHNIWIDYYYAMSDLGLQIMQIFAVALDQPPKFFDSALTRHASNLALFNYPEQDRSPDDGQLRGGAHTDFGSLTIVHSDWSIPGGLQVQAPGGGWMDVPNVPGAFVINIGDMMARWTNDRWVSTLHRVANPDAEAGRSTRRQSTVFFHNPNFDALVACIPSCQNENNPPKYKPITVGEHHLMKMGKMFEDD